LHIIQQRCHFNQHKKPARANKRQKNNKKVEKPLHKKRITEPMIVQFPDSKPTKLLNS